MYIWIMEFIGAMFSFVLSSGVCTWYFSSRQDTRGSFSLKQGFWWSFRYNFGSLAFGSFLLSVIWVARMILEFIDNQVKKLKADNGVVKCCICCTRCCLDCFHRFVKFLNDNAYIQVSLTSEPFCMAAMQACVLALKNSGTFFIANGIGGLIHGLGKGFVSIVNTGIGYLVITYIPSFREDID